MVNKSLTLSMTSRQLPSRTLAFGRRRPFAAEAAAMPAPAIGEDLKLFAATYAAGFLFVSIFLA